MQNFLTAVSLRSFYFSLKNFLATLSLVLKYDKQDGRGFVPVGHIQSAFDDVTQRYYDRYSCELSNNGVCSRGRKNPRLLFFLFLSFSLLFSRAFLYPNVMEFSIYVQCEQASGFRGDNGFAKTPRVTLATLPAQNFQRTVAKHIKLMKHEDTLLRR